MATFKSIPLSAIHVGERARPIDEGHALAIAASMAERGLINPITVRSTPAMNKGKTPYTLVAGGHRLRGAELNQWAEIDTIIVSVDAEEAQLIELSENIFRNELTALDRALFVMKYREVYEDKHGKIAPGRPSEKYRHDDGIIFVPGRELSERVKDRLGFGQSTYERVTRIGQNLRPELRSVLRGTAAENDQSALLKFAKLPADDQLKVAAALKEGAEPKEAISWTRPAPPAPDGAFVQSGILRKLVDLWADASEHTRDTFLHSIGERKAATRTVSSIREAAE